MLMKTIDLLKENLARAASPPMGEALFDSCPKTDS